MYSTLKEESSAVWRGAAIRRRQSSVANQSVESTLPEKRSPFPPGQLQLYLNVKMCIFSVCFALIVALALFRIAPHTCLFVQVGETTELYFSLYSEKERRFITEDFCVILTEAGMPEKISLLGKLTTLFKVFCDVCSL